MERFRGGLVFRAHRLLYHSTLGSRVMRKVSLGEGRGIGTCGFASILVARSSVTLIILPRTASPCAEVLRETWRERGAERERDT